jgi:cell wall-associated NlpC family hydrolase
LDTPWQHMQRCRGAGVDCVQLIGGVGLTLGLLTKEQLETVPYYSLSWHIHKGDEKLVNTLLRLGFIEVSVTNKQPGDVVTFQYARANSHAGIFLGESKIIHAPMEHPSKVTVLRLDAGLTRRLKKAFVFPHVT